MEKKKKKVSKTKNSKSRNYTSDLGWVKRGKQRRGILPFISENQTPTEISKKSGFSLNHTSRILSEFKDKELVVLHNPEEKTGRLYSLTLKGKVVKDSLEKSKKDY
jgi:predicted transcriptional regulator